MNGMTRLLLLLLNLMITRWTQQSESANCTLHDYNYMNDSGIEMAELSFEGLDGASCNMTVTTTGYIEQCLEDIEDIEITDMSCLLDRSSISPTSTALCINQTITVERSNLVAVTHTREVFSQTTIRICPTTPPLLTEVTRLVTPSTVYITQCPDCTPSTKTAIFNETQISIIILATSGVLICLPITALVIVTYCWIRTRRNLKERRKGSGPGTNHDVYSTHDRFPKSPSVHINTDDDNDTETAKEFDNPVYYDNRAATLLNMKPIAIKATNPSPFPGNDNSLHNERQTATQAKSSPPTIRAKPVVVPKHHEEQTTGRMERNMEMTAKATPTPSLLPACPSKDNLSDQSAAFKERSKPVTKASPLLPRHREDRTAVTLENQSEPTAKTKPLLPKYSSNDNSLDQTAVQAEKLKLTSTVKPILPKCTNDDASQTQNSKPRAKTTPLLPKHQRNDNPADHIAISADNSTKPKPLLPKHLNKDSAESQTAKSADNLSKTKPLLPKHLNRDSAESQTVTRGETVKATTKPKPLLPNRPNNNESQHQSVKPAENTTKAKPLLPKHLKNEEKTVTQAENSKAACKPKPMIPKHLNTDGQTVRPQDKSKPATKTKPMLPRRPSNGPIYAPLCNSDSKEQISGGSQQKSGRGVSVDVASQNNSQVDLELGMQTEGKARTNKRKEFEHKYDEPMVAVKGKKDDERSSTSKKIKHDHKYDEPMAVAKDDGRTRTNKKKELDHKYDELITDEGRASTNKRRELEHKYDEPTADTKGEEGERRTSANKRKDIEHKYDEPAEANERRVTTSKRKNREHEYDEPAVMVPVKGKAGDGRVSTKKSKGCDHLYDEPTTAAKGPGKENERKVSANKGKEREHKYDEPASDSASGKERDRKASADKQKELQHQYAKPVIAAKPKALQSKKDKGVDPRGKAEHKYHVLEGPAQGRSEDSQERREDHKYHVLEGSLPSEEDGSKMPDKQEGANVYHVLEGPTPSNENNSTILDNRESDNVYHVLEGPTPIDSSDDRPPDKQEDENVYHELEGPPEDLSKHPDEWEMENVYHVLEGPTSLEDET